MEVVETLLELLLYKSLIFPMLLYDAIISALYNFRFRNDYELTHMAIVCRSI